MEEKNRQKLTEALSKLPQHAPDPDLWQKIEASLDFEERLQQAIPELNFHEPDDALWHKIESRLEPDNEPKHFRLDTYFRYFAAAAASVALLVAVVFALRNPAREKVQIAYSEEVTTPEPAPSIQVEDPTEGIRFIQAQCSQAPEVCAKPEFKELKAQLEQLEAEDQKLKQQLEVFGQDPALIRNQIRIENLRARCTKELIQILIS